MIKLVKPVGTAKVVSAEQLLAEFRATGAQAPFEELVRRYAAMVFSECYEVTKTRHDAEDAAQATFLTLAVQARTGDEIRHLGPWLQRVARRVALDQEKAKRRRRRREDNHHRINGTTGFATRETPDLDQLELRHVMNEELNQLPAKYRMPLILHYFGGLSREQMARELNCKPATLGVRLFRAREMLGKRLSKRGIALPAVAIPMAIAMVVRESVSQHGVLAMAATAADIAHAATRVAAGLAPVTASAQSGISASAIALAETAVQNLVLRRVRSLITAAAIGASALAAGGAEVVHRIQTGSISIESIFDLSGYLRSLTAPQLPSLRADAKQVPTGDPTDWTRVLALSSQGDLRLHSLTFGDREIPSSVMVASSGAIGTQTPTPRVTDHLSGGSLGVAARPSRPAAPVTQLLTKPARPAAPIELAERPTRATHPQAAAAPVKAQATREAFAATGGESAVFSSDLSHLPLGPFFTDSTAPGLFGSPGTFRLKPVAPVPLQVLAAIRSSDAASLVAGTTAIAPPAVVPPPPVAVADATGLAPQTSQLSAEGSLLQGWGKPAGSGVLDMSGVVVADGYGQPRTLDLTAVSSIQNSVPNPPTGVNGWYAQRAGRIILSPIPLKAGNTQVTWGDSDDSRLDLVNAIRLSFRNVRPAAMASRTTDITGDITGEVPAGSVTISLLAPTHPDVPAAPDGYRALSVWQLDTTDGLTFDSFSVTARYAFPGNDLAAALSGLGLYYFGGDAWQSVAYSIDPSTRLISASDVPSTSLLALLLPDSAFEQSALSDLLGLATDGLVDLEAPVLASLLPDVGLGTLNPEPIVSASSGPLATHGNTLALTPGSRSIPEPTAVLGFIPAAAMLLGRRRRV